jgi:ubiquinone biosynthesis monooxygenase Coq6
MINAAFRLPEVSVRYLHNVVLDAQQAGMPIVQAHIQDEIAWRERSHGIDQNSAYASADVVGVGIPPAGSDSLPPIVASIQPGTVASFPIRFSHADSYIGEGLGSRTVLIGDAAHTIHPLAGQGLNMGLRDAESLARCINDAVLQGGDVGKFLPISLCYFPTS